MEKWTFPCISYNLIVSLQTEEKIQNPKYIIHEKTNLVCCAAVGGNVLAVGSLGGIAFLRMEHVRIVTYFKSVGLYALIGLVAGYFTMFLLSIL